MKRGKLLWVTALGLWTGGILWARPPEVPPGQPPHPWPVDSWMGESEGCYYYGPNPFFPPTRQGFAKTNLLDTVDLDQDGKPDLELWYSQCGSTWEICRTNYGYVHTNEYHETYYICGYFPLDHVDLYVDYRYNRREDPYRTRMEKGQWILPNPPPCPDEMASVDTPCWKWASTDWRAQRYVHSLGLSEGERHGWLPCPTPEDEYNTCIPPVRRGFFLDKFHQDAYAGFRIWESDGWHLGWIHMQYQFVEHHIGDPIIILPPKILEWVIHPDPEAPIQAGEPPRPLLQVQQKQGHILLHWSEAWKGWILEQTEDPIHGPWHPVQTTGQSYQVPLSSKHTFFRLRKQN